MAVHWRRALAEFLGCLGLGCQVHNHWLMLGGPRRPLYPLLSSGRRCRRSLPRFGPSSPSLANSATCPPSRAKDRQVTPSQSQGLVFGRVFLAERNVPRSPLPPDHTLGLESCLRPFPPSPPARPACTWSGCSAHPSRCRWVVVPVVVAVRRSSWVGEGRGGRVQSHFDHLMDHFGHPSASIGVAACRNELNPAVPACSQHSREAVSTNSCRVVRLPVLSRSS